jgi:hypothetical protein
MTPAPDRTHDQRLRALAHGNQIRTARARLKRDLKAGRRGFVELLTDPPDEILTMKIIELILATPQVGRTKANRALVVCRVSPTRRIGGLSPRERAQLADHLRYPTARARAVALRAAHPDRPARSIARELNERPYVVSAWLDREAVAS